MRWPTASIPCSAASVRATSASSAPPPGAGRSWEAATVSSWSSTRSFRLLEPALTTRIRIGAALLAPGPAADLGGVLPVLAGVGAAGHPPVGHQLAHVAGAGRQPGHPVDDVHDQVEAVQVVQHHHVERRGGGALLLVAADVEVAVVGAA